MSIKKRNWKTFFEPQSVAVVGASRTPGKLGYDVLHNIISGGFKGKIFPVNPNSDTILNLKSYASISAIPHQIDQAIFVIPAQLVPSTLEECGQKKVGSVVIISSGFKETGKEGAALEQSVAAIAQKYQINVLGPNCLGLIDMVHSLNASFAAKIPMRGNIAFLSQSGALGTAILDWAIKEGIGFSRFISLGNKVDVHEVDLIDALCDDPHTHAILGYIEDVKDGRAFLEVARRTTLKKPIIITKAGCTEAGARAASSHTGSLAGSDSAFDAAFYQTGIIRAREIQNLFDYALAFSYQPIPTGNRLAVITNAGGPGIMATDSVGHNPFTQMASLDEATMQQLRKVLPAAASVYNPVDVMGDAGSDRYEKALDIVLHDKNIDGVLVILTPQSSSRIPETADAIIRENEKKMGKPLFTAFLGGGMVAPGIEKLSQNKVPNYPFPERAVNAFSAMVRYDQWKRKPAGKVVSFKVNKEKIQELLSEIDISKGKQEVPPLIARAIAEEYGFCFPKSMVATNSEEAGIFASKIGYPLAMKIESEDISHKSDVGGVTVGLKDEDEVKKEFSQMVARVQKRMPKAKIKGVLLQEMIMSGEEVIVGVAKDPQFGPMLMFGLGGIYVEVMKDVTFRIAPLTDQDAESMIQGIRAYPLLKGVRGHEGADEEACKEALLRLSQLVMDFPQIVEMDINPLILFSKSKTGAVAIDVRMSIA